MTVLPVAYKPTITANIWMPVHPASRRSSAWRLSRHIRRVVPFPARISLRPESSFAINA